MNIIIDIKEDMELTVIDSTIVQLQADPHGKHIKMVGNTLGHVLGGNQGYIAPIVDGWVI